MAASGLTVLVVTLPDATFSSHAALTHNKRELPEGLGEEVLPFCRLVRDADKLDVFRLVQRCMREGREAELLPSHRLGLPLSETLLDEVERTGRGSYANAASMLDYLLIIRALTVANIR